MPEPVVVSWSGGKDSMLALHHLLQHGEHEVVALLTTVTGDYDRISMHGVRRTLLEAQARALGFPLVIVELAPRSSNDEYERRTGQALDRFHKRGIRTVVYGDLFLQDIRRYREKRIGRIGMSAAFPLWGADTSGLARRFLELGYRAVLTCVDSHAIDEEFAGRHFDHQLLSDLPPAVDPCGENGEFHTFVYDGPLFREPVAFQPGEVVLREDRFYYHDLLEVGHSLPS